MHKLLLSELKQLESRTAAQIRKITTDMVSDPTKEMTKVETDFRNIMSESSSNPGVRITGETLIRIDQLSRELERQKQRKESWDGHKLAEELGEWESALADLHAILQAQ